MAKLMNGNLLPNSVIWFCITSCFITSFLVLISELYPKIQLYLPNGIAFAIAMYVAPNWTIPRIIGSFIEYIWKKKNSSNSQ